MIERHPSPVRAGTSYIVRIYRRSPVDEPGRRSHDAVELIGIVEDTQEGKRNGFHNIEELWAILSGASQTKSHDQRGKGG